MHTISPASLQSYRARTFRLPPARRVTNKEEAIEFANERGFIYFWPITGILLPSLWTAVAGDRPVADEHDDPGHISWDWKDSLLGQRVWYYAKVLRKKATFISLEVVPYFYALSENYGSPEEDYLTIYEQGRLTLEAKLIYEALLDKGPMDTVSLRKAARLTSTESEGRFNRAMTDLQADFKILPTGVADAGAWHYAFFYDITARHFPEIIDQTRYIGDQQARQKLAELYFRSLGAAQSRDVTKLFGWKPSETSRALDALVQKGLLHGGLSIPDRPGEYYAIPDLC